MRNIKVFSTVTGLKAISVEDDVTTFGQLKEILDNEGINYRGHNVLENKTNTNLEQDLAVLPEGDFLIVLTPQKTKSGAFDSYGELRAAIKALIESDEDAKAHFNEGKNYTNKSRADLEELFEDWTSSEDEDIEEAEDDNEGVSNMDAIVNAILNLPDYYDNAEAYDAAIDILQNPDDFDDSVKTTPSVQLSDEERAWMNKMGVK